MDIGEVKKKGVVRKMPLKPGEIIPVEIPLPIKLPVPEKVEVPATPQKEGEYGRTIGR